jgi:hypothetical protein
MLGQIAVLAALALGSALVSTPATAQLQSGRCTPSVDTIDEGWICSLLIIATPTDSPTEAQMSLWTEVLDRSGRFGVVDGIVFSDVSIEAKVRAVYEAQLGRQPDAAGLAHWVDRVQTTRTEFAVEFGVFGSGEYRSLFDSTEAFVNDQYQYYLGREADLSGRDYWADQLDFGEITDQAFTRAIATSQEAGVVRARFLAEEYARRSPDTGGVAYWAPRAARDGLYPMIVEYAQFPEVVDVLGLIGVDLATDGEPETDPRQDLVVAPQEVVTTAVGQPIEITVLQQRDGEPIEDPLDLALLPCSGATATTTPVVFSDADDDGRADDLGSTASGQAYISEVNGEPTGGRQLYVDDAEPGPDDVLRFTVIAGPGADCAVIVVFDDLDSDRQLGLDEADRAGEPFGVTQVAWE